MSLAAEMELAVMLVVTLQRAQTKEARNMAQRPPAEAFQRA